MRSRQRASPSGAGVVRVVGWGGGIGAGRARGRRPKGASVALGGCAHLAAPPAVGACRRRAPAASSQPLWLHLPLLCRSVASPKLVMEEAPESYKDVSEVVDTCHNAGISRKAVKLRPIAVVKG